MGGSSSKEEGYSPSDSYTSQTSSSWDQNTQPRQAQSIYPPTAQPYYQAPPQQYYPQQPLPQYAPSQNASGAVPHSGNRKFDRKYSMIADSYSSLEQVTSFELCCLVYSVPFFVYFLKPGPDQSIYLFARARFTPQET